MPELPSAFRRPTPLRHPGRSDGEPIRDHPIAQPVSAGASVAYLAAAWVLWRRRHALDDPIGATWFALAVGANGVGGMAFHGPGDRVSHWAHDAALCATVGVQAARSRQGRSQPWALVAATVPATVAVAIEPRLTTPLVGVLGAATLVRQAAEATRRATPPRGPVIAAAAAAVSGIVLHRMARPTSRLHVPAAAAVGHGGWHVLSAVGLAAWGIATDRPSAKPVAGARSGRG